MGSFSVSARNSMLDVELGSGSPSIVYLAAYISGTEVSGNNYARIAVTNNATNFPAAAAGAKTNGVAFQFPQASGNWGTVDEVRLHRHASNEDIICSDTVSKLIETNDTLEIAAGAFDATLT